MNETNNTNSVNNGEERPTRVTMNDVAKSVTHGNKVGGIIVSLCMIVLGILFFVWPVKANIVIFTIATIGFIIFGVYEVITYFRTPSDLKNGWTLANGIIFVILGFLILFSSTASMLVTFTFILGFFAIFNGITQITNSAAIRKTGTAGSGLVLASGIINLLLGIFFLMAPFAALWAIAFVLGIYLIVGGVALFAESASGHHGHKV